MPGEVRRRPQGQRRREGTECDRVGRRPLGATGLRASEQEALGFCRGRTVCAFLSLEREEPPGQTAPRVSPERRKEGGGGARRARGGPACVSIVGIVLGEDGRGEAAGALHRPVCGWAPDPMDAVLSAAARVHHLLVQPSAVSPAAAPQGHLP